MIQIILFATKTKQLFLPLYMYYNSDNYLYIFQNNLNVL